MGPSKSHLTTPFFYNITWRQNWRKTKKCYRVRIFPKKLIILTLFVVVDSFLHNHLYLQRTAYDLEKQLIFYVTILSFTLGSFLYFVCPLSTRLRETLHLSFVTDLITWKVSKETVHSGVNFSCDFLSWEVI